MAAHLHKGAGPEPGLLKPRRAGQRSLCREESAAACTVETRSGKQAGSRLSLSPAFLSPSVAMKAISPVRSVRSCYEAVCCLSDQSLAIARGSSNKSPALEDPMNLLYDMNDCYSKLRELVPGIPQGSKVSQVEILQHVIDYIFDLQIVLEEQAKKGQDPTAETSLLSLKVRSVPWKGEGGNKGRGRRSCSTSSQPWLASFTDALESRVGSPAWPVICEKGEGSPGHGNRRFQSIPTSGFARRATQSTAVSVTSAEWWLGFASG